MTRIGFTTLAAIQILGLALSLFLVTVTFATRDQVEQRLQSFANAKVEAAADTAWHAVSQAARTDSRAQRLGALADRFGLQADGLEAQRDQIAYALSDRCGDNCGTAALGALAANMVLA